LPTPAPPSGARRHTITRPGGAIALALPALSSALVSPVRAPSSTWPPDIRVGETGLVVIGPEIRRSNKRVVASIRRERVVGETGANEAPSMTAEDRETIAVYDQRVEEYARQTDRDRQTGQVDAGPVEAFASAVSADGTVLDWGCGPGHDAARLSALGLEVDAVDASAAMVACAIERHGLSARRGTFDELNAVDAYDGVWANFSLLHAPHADMPRHLRAAWLALREGGACYVSVKRGERERRDALGRRYSYYTEPALSELLQESGFTSLERFGGESLGLDGVSAEWFGLLSAKRSPT